MYVDRGGGGEGCIVGYSPYDATALMCVLIPCYTSDLKIGSPVATLPGAWRYRFSAGTGQPGVSML